MSGREAYVLWCDGPGCKSTFIGPVRDVSRTRLAARDVGWRFSIGAGGIGRDHCPRCSS